MGMIFLFVFTGILLSWQWDLVKGGGVGGELYSSLEHMADLFLFDNKVGEILPFIPEYLPEGKWYKDSYLCLIQDKETLAKGDINHVAISGHPLHLYSVIKRLALYWPRIQRTIDISLHEEVTCTNKHDHCELWAQWSECANNPAFMMVYCQAACGFCAKKELRDRYAPLQELLREISLPNIVDLKGASIALARLQKIYRIPIPQIAGGTIANVTTCVTLNVYDSIRIANESFNEGDYASAWQWYHFAYSTTQNPDLRSLISSLRSQVATQHDANFVIGSDNFLPHLISEVNIQVPQDKPYFKLCRGITLMDPVTLSRFKCYVSSQGSPYLILRPIKCEHVHDDPEMYVFYDVLSDVEIREIQATATSRLHRSGVLSSESPQEIRVSQTGWLPNASHPLLPAICRRVSAVTGLLAYEADYIGAYGAGEHLQVLSYGIGGHYDHHYDPLWKFTSEDAWQPFKEKCYDSICGDRIATWMFYLSDVEAGGRTAFPHAGVSVTPVKGSAVFWYNLKKNGLLNHNSYHGGCPVLLGHKWVANKWIRENENFLRRPCSLDEDE